MPATRTTSDVDTRTRIVTAAAGLMQRGGYQTMSLKQIGAEASVSGGSIYHFFPGGKEDIAVAAVIHAEEEFADFLRSSLATREDPGDAVEACAEHLARRLEESDWVDGCPLTATGLESVGRSDAIRSAVAAAFEHWSTVVADRLVEGGLDRSRAATLGTTVVNSLEGAEVAAQMTCDAGPLLTSGRHLAELVRAVS